MTRPALAAIAAALALSACGNEAPATAPGSPAVHERISNARSCAALQREFDRAMSNVERIEPGDPRREPPLAYASAAADRQEDLGC